MMGDMVDRDTAFLWETEALRSVTHRPMPARGRVERVDADEDWLTLREANEVTGIPVPTLRKWARGDNVPSRLEETPMGQLRMVSLQGIYQRAGELGREVRTRPAQPPRDARKPNAPAEVDLTPDDSEARTEVKEGTMLVPLDAWNKILNQLGNLHEAGQQLAEARERAAKAETEATFLKERLAELRAELAEAGSTKPPPAGRVAEPPTHAPIEHGEGQGSASRGDEPPGRDRLTFAGYSMEIVRQLFSTWKGRPRR